MENLPTLEEQKEYILEHLDFPLAAKIIYLIGRITSDGDLIPWYYSGFEKLPICTAQQIKDVITSLLTEIISSTEETDFAMWGPIKITRLKDRVFVDLALPISDD